ncbi:hypothetical protein Vretimale_15599 [Volvox reticuliferus]|uniref:SBP-type domain-containing protein n=1 Tax=Volvox reticuliferus TaxID=1737510 RepID=A0A8J4FS94_9CHLO|nr:hypothetical protein Vretifemale_14976 [Volvox reticuliferus]GIM12195.1 hypothetical protein Vretimale_15599 [Volvox reticuliferus]
MADVFSSSFAAEQHTAWAAGQYAWDPSQLQALPIAGSPASGSTAASSEHGSEGPCSSAGAQRDQSLGPVPVGWQDTTRGGTGGGTAAGKEMKGAPTRAPKGPLVCQVEGCGHDLSVEKGYYQRYRVCEPHMKLLSLVVNGKACRFCQQCGRFQELTEFDGNKRSCRARLLQHNARRRKRDPLETSRRDISGSRKSKSHHPWSDSSNDADMGHGSGNDKGMANYSTDNGVDQGVKIRMGVAPVSSGGMSTWNPGMSGSVEAPGSVNQLQRMLQQPLAVPVPPASIDGDFARCFSAGSDMGDALDEMLDGILNSNTDYLEDPRAALLPAPPAVLPVVGGPFGTASAAMATGPLSGGSFTSGPEVKPPQLGMVSLGMQSSPAISGTMIGTGSLASSVPTSGAWQPGGMGLDTVGSAADLAAAINKRVAQQRQLQEHQLLQQLQQHQIQQLQQQHKLQQQLLLQQQQQQQQQLQQQLLQQQQHLNGVITRGPMNTAASSSMMQMDTFMDSSIVTGGYDNTISGGLIGQVNGTLNRSLVAPWAGPNIGNAVSVPEMMSGSMSMNSNMSHASIGMSGMATSGPMLPSATSAAASGSSSFDIARRLVASGGAAAQYQSEDLLIRVSVKIANCTPDQLPADLYQRLRNLLSTADASLVQGFLRPGCTHLVLDVQVDSGAQAVSGFGDGAPGGGASPGLAVSAADLRCMLGPAMSRCAILVQTDREVAMWPAGAPAASKPHKSACIADLEAAGELPFIQHVSAAAHIDAEGCAAVLVYGMGLTRPGVELCARIQGGYVPLTVNPLMNAGRIAAAAAADPKMAAATARAVLFRKALERAGRKSDDILLVTVKDAPGTGLLLLEAQMGPLLGNWRPCLLSTDAAIAAELSMCAGRTVREGGAALASLEAFILDLGRVLDKRSYTTTSSRSCDVPDSGLACVDEVDEARADPSVAQDLWDEGKELNEVTLALVCVCERLLATATDLGMARVSTFLAGALWQYGQDVQAILEAPYADGLAIVHRCVRSGSPAVVRALLSWIKMSGVQIDLGTSGALGVSPLHLAALIPATWEVLATLPAARKSWWSSKSLLDGATPFQLQQMLLSQLPRGALPQDVVNAFAPKPRPVPHCGTVMLATETSPSVPAVDVPAEIVTERHFMGGKAGGSYSKSRGAVVMMVAMFILSILATVIPSWLSGPKAAVNSPEGSDTAALATDTSVMQRIFATCCSTMMYVSLLGLAIHLLPLNKAAIMSQFTPSSTCLAP